MQAAFAFDTPYTLHQRDGAAELARLDTAKSRVLARLQRGPATNVELNAICFRYGARVWELQRDGYRITKAPLSRGVWEYTLEGGA